MFQEKLRLLGSNADSASGMTGRHLLWALRGCLAPQAPQGWVPWGASQIPSTIILDVCFPGCALPRESLGVACRPPRPRMPTPLPNTYWQAAS